MPDFRDYKNTARTSDGMSCFWVVGYKVTALVQTTSPDHENLHRREVNVLSLKQPTIAEAYRAVPADERERVTRVSVKPMHSAHLGNAFIKAENFVDLDTGCIGPLTVQVEHVTSIGANERAADLVPA